MALNVKIKRWNGMMGNRFKEKTSEILSGVIPFNNVVLDNPGYRKFLKPSNQSTDLYIVIWGYHSSKQIAELHTGATAWGIDIPWKQDILSPSGQGKEIITPEGLAIAEFIDPNVLAIFCNLSGMGSEDDLKIYEEILYEVAEMFGYTKEVLRSMKNNRSTIDTTNFLANICNSRLSDEKNRLSRLKNDVEFKKKEFFQLLKQEKEIVELISSLEKTMQSDIEKVKKEIESCTKMNHVKSVSVDKNSIVVTTDMIYIYHDNLKYKIGEFDIYINPISGDVTFKNISQGYRRRSVWGSFCHHPHINEGGRACWGNVSGSVMTLINDNEYEALVSVLISYLESVNISDSAGEKITWWDVVDEDDNIVRRGLDPSEARMPVCPICGERKHREHMISCSDCGALVCASCATNARRESNGMIRKICNNCVENYHPCRHCGAYIPNSSNEELCISCKNKECISCGLKFSIDNLTRINDRLYCDGCRENSFVKCDFCENHTRSEDSLFCEMCGRNTCASCGDINERGSNICTECRGR